MSARKLPQSVKTYSRKADGAKQLSKNFKVSEFACRDGSDPILICDELVRLLQALRDYKGSLIQVNSGYRNLAYNRRVGSTDGSFHTRGQAADIAIASNTPRQVYDAIDSGRVPGIDPAKIGLGLYRSFVHIDSRGSKGRWAGTGVKL